MLPAKLEEEFSRPVESIMRCEDFKSNFARRLSNRYISRSPATARDSKLKLRPAEGNSDHAPERIEPSSQLSKSVADQNGECAPVKPPDKAAVKNSDIRCTEVSALNLEVETLRWQLAQTEGNRQMHIALLKQIVTFLSRVKEHIECQKPNSECIIQEGILAKSFDATNLPMRSRSVLHVNKNIEYSLSPNKRVNSRKISKSISNVNGYKHNNGAWSQPKFALTSEAETAHKITEEMSRLITLANTVLSTKLPDLACTCNDLNDMNNDRLRINDEKKVHQQSTLTLSLHESTDAFVLNAKDNADDVLDGLTYKYEQTNDNGSNSSTEPSPGTCDAERDFDTVTLFEPEPAKLEDHSPIIKNRKSTDKKCESIFIEDESGFSSMSSFQEIGIPIISIIPPSPCKEIAYLEDVPDLLEDASQWKASSIDIDKQTMKVFWV